MSDELEAIGASLDGLDKMAVDGLLMAQRRIEDLEADNARLVQERKTNGIAACMRLNAKLRDERDALALVISNEHGPDYITEPDLQRILTARLAAERKAGAEERDHMTLREIQEDQRPWVIHNFGDRPVYFPLLGAVEELGELAHAHLKAEQGIRGTKAEHEAAAKDAVADIIIFLLDYCSARGWDAASIVSDTWKVVRTRDFKADPLRGMTGMPSVAKIERGEVTLPPDAPGKSEGDKQ